MLSPTIAAWELERRRAEETAEFARQLPLYRDETPYWPDPSAGTAGEDTPNRHDWATFY